MAGLSKDSESDVRAFLHHHPTPAGIYWANFEEKYHFSAQFTADLISMNMSDFIITSTYQVNARAGRLHTLGLTAPLYSEQYAAAPPGVALVSQGTLLWVAPWVTGTTRIEGGRGAGLGEVTVAALKQD